MSVLLYGDDVDRRLNWPLGKAERLARRGKLPHLLLPDGSIRFRWKRVRALIIDYVIEEAERKGLSLTRGSRLSRPTPGDTGNSAKGGER